MWVVCAACLDEIAVLTNQHLIRSLQCRALFDCPLMRKWSVGQARVQALAANNKTRLHLPDGPEQSHVMQK
jgi:hypothetical protein